MAGYGMRQPTVNADPQPPREGRAVTIGRSDGDAAQRRRLRRPVLASVGAHADLLDHAGHEIISGQRLIVAHGVARDWRWRAAKHVSFTAGSSRVITRVNRRRTT